MMKTFYAANLRITFSSGPIIHGCVKEQIPLWAFVDQLTRALRSEHFLNKSQRINLCDF